MSSKFQQFKDLHKSDNLFVLPNAWNAASALLFQTNGFPAIATSSAAVAGSLGYEDGEQMPFSEYLFIIRRILSAVQAPVTVDIEMGYGNSNEAIYDNIMQLIDQGIVGINIEDSIIQGGERTLKEAAQFARTIEFVRNKLASEGHDLFINIRCDAFILNVPNKLEEALRRLKTYEITGIDGIFLPCIAEEKDIATVIQNTSLPLNVMAIPGLPGFDTLQQLGVRRVSTGNFLYDKTYAVADKLVHEIISDRNFSSILS